MNQTEAINLIYPKLEEEMKGCDNCPKNFLKETLGSNKLPKDFFHLCSSCDERLQTHLNDWKGELESRKLDLVDNISEQEYLNYVFGYLEDSNGVRELTEERLENVKKDYLKKKERIQALEIVIKLIEEKLK